MERFPLDPGLEKKTIKYIENMRTLTLRLSVIFSNVFCYYYYFTYLAYIHLRWPSGTSDIFV